LEWFEHNRKLQADFVFKDKKVTF